MDVFHDDEMQDVVDRKAVLERLKGKGKVTVDEVRFSRDNKYNFNVTVEEGTGLDALKIFNYLSDVNH